MSAPSPIRFFSADLDGTLLGADEATRQFAQIWTSMAEAERPLLCYNTGRLLDDVRDLVATGRLPRPDYIISGVGTNVYDVEAEAVMKAFNQILDEGWDIERIEQILTESPYEITRQPAHFQTPYKSSWFLDDAAPEQIAALEQALDEAGLDVHVVYSSARFLDVLPKWANKGNALRWLLRQLDIPPAEVLVAGDSGNDNAMFTLNGVRGIVVGNAQPELLELTWDRPVYRAPPDVVCGHGVLAGLRHFHALSENGLPGVQEAGPALLDTVIRTAGEEADAPLSGTQFAFVHEGYRRAVEALHRNVTPMGFSACSLDDNEVTGTDENYRSVWARDGAITVLGAMPLLESDPTLHACQRQTLATLLDHMSPNGQIPANVRIDDGVPDYSGVGGIASVDSGMWVTIAFYAYVARTQDHEFLRRYIEPLQKVMDWLSAHDSNNDALLEIPEAGDWTDLFGRSYNVLYDEVIWHRANVCFGRMLQMLGDEQRAGDYLRWAWVIQREILANFWPSTQENIYQTPSFAEQQYSIGDARYLLAQLTPFDFSWRCDTFGNILAFLYDIVDAKRASQIFRFMWGVGVNEPHPIVNLYPVVTVGDKDWRSYYAVNLLNLPHHYHNGGIWPFVGGHWVRFINKLGLRNQALQELFRLAELNHLGVLHEWEFNEWAHGLTGRPMGKAFQAWSASEFIRACHDLQVVPE